MGIFSEADLHPFHEGRLEAAAERPGDASPERRVDPAERRTVEAVRAEAPRRVYLPDKKTLAA